MFKVYASMKKEITYQEAIDTVMAGGIVEDEDGLLIRVVGAKIEVLTNTQGVLYAGRLNSEVKYYEFGGLEDVGERKSSINKIQDT